jgi:hypothetical protein
VTREKVQAKKDKAVRFVRDVLDDPDRAEEIEDESLEDYAGRVACMPDSWVLERATKEWLPT